MISLVQSHYHEGSSVDKRSLLRWEGFIEKVFWKATAWSIPASRSQAQPVQRSRPLGVTTCARYWRWTLRCCDGELSSRATTHVTWFVEKVGLKPGAKERRSDGWWERGWWEGWVDKWLMRWIETRLARTAKWIWKLIPNESNDWLYQNI